MNKSNTSSPAAQQDSVDFKSPSDLLKLEIIQGTWETKLITLLSLFLSHDYRRQVTQGIIHRIVIREKFSHVRFHNHDVGAFGIVRRVFSSAAT